MLLLIVLNLSACRSSEPVLSGVVDQGSEASAERYAKADGVWIDLAMLSGAQLDQVRGLLSMQMGDVLETVELPSGKGRKLVFAQGQVLSLIHI